MFVCCELSGRGLCNGLITRPEESYRLWRVDVCDLETSRMGRLKARYQAVKNTTKRVVTPRKQTNLSRNKVDTFLVCQQLRIYSIEWWDD